MTVIEAEDLCVRYGQYAALEGVTFTVADGDFLAVVGPNGSGKTTLLKAILGLVPAASGRILLDGRVPAEAVRVAAVGYLPQRPSFVDPRFPATAREVVRSGLQRGAAGARGDVEVDGALALLRIAELAGRRVGELSGGQQQRVHLARALARNPRILILDEPTGALDPESRECFYETLVEINAERGVTIVLVSHDLASVSRAARTTLYLDRRPRYYGSLEGFAAHATEHYFGSGHRHAGSRDAR